MIKCECQHCREKMTVPDSLAGQFEECPTCKILVAVPGPYTPDVPASWVAPGKNECGPAYVLDPAERACGPAYICPNPNCGYRGPAIRKPRGSLIVAILLCVLFLPFGLLYILLYHGDTLTCPRCHNQLGGR